MDGGEAGDVAEAVTGAEEAWVAEAGAAEAGVAEAGATEAEAGVTDAGPAVAGAIEAGGAIAALSVEAGAGVVLSGAGVVGGLPMAMVTGVVARTDIAGAIAGVVFPSMATDTARQA